MAEDPNAVTARNHSKDPVADPSLIEALPHDAEAGLREVIGDIGRLDRAVYGIIADTPTPSLDIPLRELSSLANHSKIWFAIAGGLALVGGETGRLTFPARHPSQRSGTAVSRRSSSGSCERPPSGDPRSPPLSPHPRVHLRIRTSFWGQRIESCQLAGPVGCVDNLSLELCRSST